VAGEGTPISHATVARIWHRFGVQPWRVQTFKFSTDPALEAKVRDVVGLYLHPPEKAVVLCVDEKPQLQALERTAPVLPVRPGSAERAAFDYVRHGTTTLFAALEVATGKVTEACTDRHRHQEFPGFLKQVAAAYPRQQLYVVVDNYATHKHPAVRAWLERHPRVTLHVTPTSGPWLNLVEAFFSITTRQALRRGNFPTVADLIAAIERFIAAWNDRCTPFTWTKDPDTVIVKATDPRRRKTKPRQLRSTRFDKVFRVVTSPTRVGLVHITRITRHQPYLQHMRPLDAGVESCACQKRSPRFSFLCASIARASAVEAAYQRSLSEERQPINRMRSNWLPPSACHLCPAV
jgi:transposase